VSGRFHLLAEERVDGRMVAVARILLGIAALLLAVEEAVTLTRVLEASTLQLPLAGWVPHMSTDAVSAYFLLWCITALLFTVGWHASLAGGVLVVLLVYPLLLDEQSYSNHLYLALLVALLVTLAHPGARMSLDARLGRGERTSPWWPVLLAKCQLSIAYGYAALAKLNGDYLSGGILEDNLTGAAVLELPAAVLDADVLRLLAAMSIAAELFLAVGFWSRRLRIPALAVGTGLHLGILLVFPVGLALELTAFALTMFALYALSWAERVEGVAQASRPRSSMRSIASPNVSVAEGDVV
jgi:hypothetical protein